MKISKKNNNSSKKTALVISLIVVVLAASAGAFYLTTRSEQKSKNTESTTNSQNKPIDVTDTTSGNNVDTKPNDSTATPDTGGASSQNSASISISSKNQTDSIYQIRTLIDVVTSSGTCTLTLTKGSQVISRQSTVQAGPSSSTCVGFDIPMKDLTSGTWILSILFKNEQHQGNVSQEVVIR